MRIKPASPGAIIRDPDTRRPLPEEGAEVQASTFWLRRLRDGEVVEIEPTADPEPESKQETAPEPARASREHQERRGEMVTPLEIPEVAPPADRMTRSTTKRGA